MFRVSSVNSLRFLPINGITVDRTDKGMTGMSENAIESEARGAARAVCSSQSTVFRLPPGADLKRTLIEVVTANGWGAAAVATVVGSLDGATLRYANRQDPVRIDGPLEILSVSGTLGPNNGHLHLAVSDGDGRVYGGHLLDGCSVFTTAEVVLTLLQGLVFERAQDPDTSYRELQVRRAPG